MRFSTVEQPDLQQLQMKRLQQQQATRLANFNYHPAAVEGAATTASVTAPPPRFSHSILLQQQDHHRHHHHHR
jgi:hypothetical protein